MNHLFLIIALTFVFSVLSVTPLKVRAQPETTSPADNYLKLELLFSRYDGALFGSRPYRERVLREHLYDLLYKEIETMPDFILISPEGLYEKGVQSRLRYKRWLDLRGDVDPESAYDASGKNIKMLQSWWRSGILVSVRGKVLKARITNNPYGRSVEIYLEKIKIIRHTDKG